MQETLLLYHIEESMRKVIEEIAEQLHIQIQDIDDSQLGETMGYILKMEGFEKSHAKEIQGDFQQEFLFFAGMSHQQLDILLQLFQMQGLPRIPYKAMLTEHNIHYPFYKLYLSVADEYHQMSQMSQTEHG